MALERQSIEKKDFPIGRRGYDPDAVDSHLAQIADQVDELKRTARRRSETLASAASEQVRAIVEAAESSAAQIQREAEDEAAEIRSDASSEAQRTREQASEQAREYVGRVSESTAVMLQRLDAMESELSALTEALRTGANRLNADLQLLEGNLTEVTEAAAPRPRFEPEAGGAAGSRGGVAGVGTGAPSALPEPVAEPGTTASVADQAEVFSEQADAPVSPHPGAAGERSWDLEQRSEAFDLEPVDTDPELGEADVTDADLGDGGAGSADDTEGARLIALNMALNGTPREETDRYLADNFDLADRGRLLDEVYASVGG